jgi:hypothetical protein
MAIRENIESVEAVRVRLLARFPENTAEVIRQLDLAVACAEHLGVRVTPQLLENLVTEHLHARAASRPAPIRTSPAVPLVCRGPRPGDRAVTGPGSTVV